jgi:two-component system chemotaxis sensor kinase CheA
VDTEALKKSLLSKFVEVTQDRLQAIQLGILELEKPGSEKAAEAVARDLHTMKGEARMLGLAAIGQLAHAAEDLLKAQRDGKLDVRAATDHLLHACDAIADLLEDLDAAKEGNEASQTVAQRLAQASGVALPPLHPGAAKPAGGLGVRVKPRAPAAGASNPPPVPAPPASSPSGLRSSAPGATAEPERADRGVPMDRSIRVNVETLDALGLLAGDLLVESARAGLRG